MLKIRVDNTELNSKKKEVSVKISITVSDVFNSIDSLNVYFSRLNSGKKITKGRFFGSECFIRISSLGLRGAL